MDKGTISNLVSALVLALGFLLPEGEVQRLILYAGMFALSGGITNSLAVKMLFDRIPPLVGSGVIPNRFREIRQQIKGLIIEHFFSEDYLRDFLRRNKDEIDWNRYVDLPTDGGGPVRAFVEKHWERLTASENLRPVISSQVDQLMSSAFGGFLHLVGKRAIEGLVGDFVGSFAHQMKGRVLEACSTLEVSPDALRLELKEENVIGDLQTKVDVLLGQKLQQLDAPQVKRMMENVIRNHLGWLVVWGSVFGGLLGVAAYFTYFISN